MPIRPTVARFAVASKNSPQLTDTIILADRVHAALVSLSNGSSIFTGCDEQGRPLQGNRHAHVFCESNNALAKGIDGEITHITIYAPAGFESEDQRAVQDLNRVWGGDDLEIQVILLGFGQPQDFGGTDLERGQCPLLARSRAWVSRTPFIPTRHPKVTRAGALKRGRERPADRQPGARSLAAAGAGGLSADRFWWSRWPARAWAGGTFRGMPSSAGERRAREGRRGMVQATALG